MIAFSPFVEELVSLALKEDLCGGDVTTAAIFDGSERSQAILVAKAPLVLAGGPIFRYVMQRVAQLPGHVGPAPEVIFDIAEGTLVEAGTQLARLHGPTTSLLMAERLALNLLQKLSGIATTVRTYAEALGNTIAITDTRKTTPGLRELERYAVRLGGGRNHRFNLAGGVLIKENHIAAAGGIAAALERAHRYAPHTLRVEIEVTTLDELREAIDGGADIVMLDNMDMATMREAVRIADRRVILEVSGNVTLERCEALSTLGIDLVSSGAITHSVAAADISLLFRG